MILPLQNALGPLGRRLYGRPFGGHATLGIDCVGAWHMDEESGVRVNAADPGPYDLTVFDGPVGFVADGKRRNAADFNANEHAGSTGTPPPMDLFTLSLWVRCTTVLTSGFITLGGAGGWPNGSSGTLYTNSGQQLTGVLGNLAAGDYSLNQRNLDLNDGAWHFCVGRFNRLTGQIDLTTDNTPWDKAMSTVCTTPTLNAPTRIWFHSYYDETRDLEAVDIDEVLLHSRWVSEDEVTDLWNDGAGLFF